MNKHQSKYKTATPVPYGPSYGPKPFKRCGYCGDLKPQCREQQKCLKDFL